MPSLRIIEATAAEWGVSHAVLGMLHAPGADHTTRQEAGQRDAGGHRTSARKPWPGCRIGVRPPGIDETPLSDAEVIHGMTRCLL